MMRQEDAKCTSAPLSIDFGFMFESRCCQDPVMQHVARPSSSSAFLNNDEFIVANGIPGI